MIELCRRLDGVPLAIRLSAARLPLLGLAGVVSRLDERLQLLAAGGRDAPARQQTLLAALDWSFGLLSAPEQALFRRLGVFVGGFSLDMAIALARCESVDEWMLIERLNMLVERNLVDVDRAASPRYSMLETQRHYAAHLLRARGDMADARRDHARAVDSVMRRAGDEIWEMTDAAWLPRWASELDNVRAALDWSAANDATLFALLVGSVGSLFRLLDLAYELRQRATAVNPEVLATVAPEPSMRYWLTRSYLEAGVSARAAYDCACRAEAAARVVGDARGLYLALCHRVSSGQLPPAEIRDVLSEIDALESATWPPRMRAYRAVAEYTARSLLSQWPQAQMAAERGVALAAEGGSLLMQGFFANAVLVTLLGQKKVRDAIDSSHKLRRLVLPGPAGSAIPFVGTSARCALAAGDVQGARRLLVQLFGMCRVVDWMYFDYFAHLYLTLALAEGRTEAAARLLGNADAAAARRSWSVARMTADREDARSTLAAKLSQDRLTLLVSEGAASNRESVCEWVLNDDECDGGYGVGAPALTARQAEVLRLVGQGNTDKQVAQALGLSPRTVEMHVARAIKALKCRNRAEAARMVAVGVKGFR